jgi:CheY-like chemotaxis protein
MINIILVDDDPALLHSTKLLLESVGYNVEAFDNAPAAKKRSGEKDFDILICDIVMPDMEGTEVMIDIRKQKVSGRKVPKAIFISGRPEYLNIVYKLGADGILDKPFTREDLKTIINRVMSE